MPVETLEEAKEFVKRLMVDRKVFRHDASDKNEGTAHFLFDGASEREIAFSIQQPKTLPRVVGIIARVSLDPQQIKVFANFGQRKRDRFLSSLGKNLLFVNPTFMLGPKPEALEWVMFIKEISYDELTEGRLIDGIDQVSRAVILVSSLIIDELGDPKSE